MKRKKREQENITSHPIPSPFFTSLSNLDLFPLTWLIICLCLCSLYYARDAIVLIWFDLIWFKIVYHFPYMNPLSTIYQWLRVRTIILSTPQKVKRTNFNRFIRFFSSSSMLRSMWDASLSMSPFQQPLHNWDVIIESPIFPVMELHSRTLTPSPSDPRTLTSSLEKAVLQDI